jgi:cytidylate kinase
MNTPLGFEKCLTFINCHLAPSDKPVPHGGITGHPPVVTISRQSGSGGHQVAEKLLELLKPHSLPESPPWTIFDRNLVERILEDHHLPKRLAKFMLEDRISGIADTLDELFGLHPPAWTLVRKSADTILHLAELGNVILIGRGAYLITAKLEYAFHVRLVGSVERRARHMQELEKLSPKAALDFVRQEDRSRARYVRKYFKKDINDPLLHHLVINTDLVSYEHAAQLIAQALLSRMPAIREEKPRFNLTG